SIISPAFVLIPILPPRERHELRVQRRGPCLNANEHPCRHRITDRLIGFRANPEVSASLAQPCSIRVLAVDGVVERVTPRLRDPAWPLGGRAADIPPAIGLQGPGQRPRPANGICL